MARLKSKRRYKKSYTRKGKRSYSRRNSSRRPFGRTRSRGMQRIKTVRWPARNIGGDRAFCKLVYTQAQDFGIPVGTNNNTQNLAFNVGASSGALPTITSILGQTPGLQVLAATYLHYRIKGIGFNLTYWQTSATPLLIFTNAASSSANIAPTTTGPQPAFPTITVNNTPEQRWAKTRVTSATSQGGRATTLKSYYSVNKVMGPDSVVRNDEDYTGQMSFVTPYFSADTAAGSQPIRGPFCQFGITTLSGAPVAGDPTTGVLKIGATVYCEFFGKRPSSN